MMMYDDLIKQLRYCADATTCRHCPWRSECCLHDAQRKAADAIEELMRRCEQFQYMPPPAWIPVSVRLPKEDEAVMTWGENEIVLIDWLHDNKWCCFGEATYWMPLPSAPTEE